MLSVCQLAGLTVCLLAVVAAQTLHARPPRIGFLAMRGKRNATWPENGSGDSGGPLVARHRRFTYPLHRLMRLDNLYDDLYTRADRTPFGFTGLRGKKAPSGFGGLRGKRVYSGFGGLRGKKVPYGFSGMRGKKVPVGFSGMRGKKIPSGFGGMRGKRPTARSSGSEGSEMERTPASAERSLASRLMGLGGLRSQQLGSSRHLLLADE
ncbi:Tachykinin [Amphibalanus amphitrite]|uniref:Tachykinin n=1 Tax=Amphibalanus amphitrite TaxID=1232801 RepID=A0A6A4W778_AMPAM|nr:Tachykinin [Amphibalanus amphitrite]